MLIQSSSTCSSLSPCRERRRGSPLPQDFLRGAATFSESLPRYRTCEGSAPFRARSADKSRDRPRFVKLAVNHKARCFGGRLSGSPGSSCFKTGEPRESWRMTMLADGSVGWNAPGRTNPRTTTHGFGTAPGDLARSYSGSRLAEPHPGWLDNDQAACEFLRIDSAQRLDNVAIHGRSRHVVRESDDNDAAVAAEREREQVCESEIGGHQRGIPSDRCCENLPIGTAAQTDFPNVFGRETGVVQSPGQGAREILVYEVAGHPIGSLEPVRRQRPVPHRPTTRVHPPARCRTRRRSLRSRFPRRVFRRPDRPARAFPGLPVGRNGCSRQP